MELTPEAEARVREAIESVRADVEAIRHMRERRAAIERFASLWDEIGPGARGWIQYRLGEVSDGEPSKLDVGNAARALLDEFGGKQGERLDSFPIKAAVQELFAAYVDAGGEPEIGNRAHRSAEGRPEHPACSFVAKHLARLFPETFQHAHDAARRADTYLREFSSRSQIPTRKKRLI